MCAKEGSGGIESLKRKTRGGHNPKGGIGKGHNRVKWVGGSRSGRLRIEAYMPSRFNVIFFLPLLSLFDCLVSVKALHICAKSCYS